MTKLGQFLANSDFLRHIECDFLIENHKISFHSKNKEDLLRNFEDIRPNRLKIDDFGQKWPNFDHFGQNEGQKLFRLQFFKGHRSVMET